MDFHPHLSSGHCQHFFSKKSLSVESEEGLFYFSFYSVLLPHLYQLIVERLVMCLGEFQLLWRTFSGVSAQGFLNRSLPLQWLIAMFLQLVSVVVHTLYASSSEGAKFEVAIIDRLSELPTTRLIIPYVMRKKKKSGKRMGIFIYVLSNLIMPFFVLLLVSDLAWEEANDD